MQDLTHGVPALIATAVLTASMAGAMPQVATPPCGDLATDPCPLALERLCEPESSSGQVTLGSACECACGTGMWATQSTVRTTPTLPVSYMNQMYSSNLTRWLWSTAAFADADHAEASFDLLGSSHLWSIGSFTRRAGASQMTRHREWWVGLGPPCPRLVSLAASGGAIVELGMSCAARPGCSASGSVTIAGSCSSLGKASASLSDKTVHGSVGYRSFEQKMEISGKFGAEIEDNGLGIEGKISSLVQWKLTGDGSVSGSAAYTVTPDRTYCAFTNRPVVRRSNGKAAVIGGGTVSDNGTIAVSGLAMVSMGVQ